MKNHSRYISKQLSQLSRIKEAALQPQRKNYYHYSTLPQLPPGKRLTHHLNPIIIINNPSPKPNPNPNPTPRTRIRTMSSSTDDAAYTSFLEKANQPTTGSDPKSQSSSSTATTAKTVTTSSIPAPLRDLDEYYISETDEPFEAVSLAFDGRVLDRDSFTSLISSASEVQEMTPGEWDPKGQYKVVMDTVSRVLDGEKDGIKVYRVESGKARVEYWIVGLKEGVVVGVRAKAVES